MSDETTTLQFIQNRLPVLETGVYTVTLSQVVNIPQTDATQSTESHIFHAPVQTFQVFSERFSLSSDEIVGVFPPDGGTGDYAAVLPHIVFKRSTLPWERLPTPAIPNIQVSWLVLLLLDESESHLFQVNSQSLASLLNDPSFTAPPAENSDDPDQIVTVLTVDTQLLQTLMPPRDSALSYLAHVRSTPDMEVALVVGNRLPQTGSRSTVHLVSVEGRYDTAGTFIVSTDTPTKLVSLASWQFTSADATQSFNGLVTNLNVDVLRLSAISGDAAAFQQQGFAPLSHKLPNGDQTFSWYRSPFATGNNSTVLPLPVRSADALIHYDPTYGLLDMTYAAAWELGRLMALQSNQFSQALYSWKAKRRGQTQAQQQLQESPFSIEVNVEQTLPPSLQKWLLRLALLVNVPFNYLVPNSQMLPTESLRFFTLDQTWLAALLDGAYSIGRVSAADQDLDAQFPLSSLLPDRPATISGFLLRSGVVSGFPTLKTRAYQAEKRLSILRQERLSPFVWLVLYDGLFDRVEFHISAEALHFEFETRDGTFFKILRDTEGTIIPDLTVTATLQNQVVDIGTLVNQLNTALASFSAMLPVTSAQFAFEMIEASKHFVFHVNFS